MMRARWTTGPGVSQVRSTTERASREPVSVAELGTHIAIPMA